MPPILKMTKRQRYLRGYNRKYYDSHKTEKKAYRELHKAEIAERLKAYYESHKAEAKAYYKSHKVEIAEKRKAYYKSHKAKMAEQVKAYQSETFIHHVGRANKSAKRLGLKGKLTLAEVTGMFERYDDKCFYCGVKLVEGISNKRHPADRNIDHFIPFSGGGKNVISNIRPCCFSCNRLKFTEVEGWHENCNLDNHMVEIMAEIRRERKREYDREYRARHKKLN